jgi:hypothetical protein
MTTSTGLGPSRQEIVKGAITSGGINAVINGAIQAWLLWGTATIPISGDAISAGTHTVLGAAVAIVESVTWDPAKRKSQ